MVKLPVKKSSAGGVVHINVASKYLRALAYSAMRATNCWRYVTGAAEEILIDFLACHMKTTNKSYEQSLSGLPLQFYVKGRCTSSNYL